MKKNLKKMMARSLSMAVAVLFVCSAMSLTSCSSDSEGGNGGPSGTPQYESVSALYNVTSSSTGIGSIELTASGNYIVQPAYGSGRRALGLKPSFLGHAAGVTRAAINGIYYGKFTKVSDTEFILEGFGRLVIGGTSDNATTLTITLEDGTVDTVTATKADQYESSSMTNKLCRTWNLGKVGYKVVYDGQTLIDQTYNSYSEFLKEREGGDLSDKELEYELAYAPKQVIFTKSGTYVVVYGNDELGVSTWAWEDENKGIARYSWNYDSLYDPYESGEINISFNGSEALVTEGGEGSEDGHTYSAYVVWHLNEAK